MTKEEALTLLKDAPRSERISRVNISLTVNQCIEITKKGIMTFPDGAELPDLFEKRVHQVCQDRIRPNY